MTDAHLRDAFYLMIGFWLSLARPNGYEYRSPPGGGGVRVGPTLH